MASHSAKGQLGIWHINEILKVIDASELASHVEITIKRASGSFWHITLTVSETALFLLQSSLKDGMLRRWGNCFSFADDPASICEPAMVNL